MAEVEPEYCRHGVDNGWCLKCSRGDGHKSCWRNSSRYRKGVGGDFLCKECGEWKDTIAENVMRANLSEEEKAALPPPWKSQASSSSLQVVGTSATPEALEAKVVDLDWKVDNLQSSIDALAEKVTNLHIKLDAILYHHGIIRYQ